jgi:hypothetical protein
VVYQSMKFELDIPYIRGSTKNDKVWQILIFWNLTPFATIDVDVGICHVCIDRNIRYFELKFSMFVDNGIFYM